MKSSEDKFQYLMQFAQKYSRSMDTVESFHPNVNSNNEAVQCFSRFEETIY